MTSPRQVTRPLEACTNPRDCVECRGFPGTVGAEERDDLAVVDAHRDVGNADQIAVAHLKVLNDKVAHADRLRTL
jgi:hypothetical protein